MALSFGSVISFSYICIVNEKDGLLRRESRLRHAHTQSTQLWTPTKKPLSGLCVLKLL
jgi:hypothetical protein